MDKLDDQFQPLNTGRWGQRARCTTGWGRCHLPVQFSRTRMWLWSWECDHQFRTHRRGRRSGSFQLDHDCFDSFGWFRWACLQWIDSDGVLHSHISALYRRSSTVRYIRCSGRSQSNRGFPKCSLHTRRLCSSTVASERRYGSEWYRSAPCFPPIQHC